VAITADRTNRTQNLEDEGLRSGPAMNRARVIRSTSVALTLLIPAPSGDLAESWRSPGWDVG
jgi:hypothetical protein